MGINLFHPKEEFFLIDSDNLDETNSRLYGYYISTTGVYDNSNYDEDSFKNCQGRGCYVNIIVNKKEVRIFQDFAGSWGLYYFYSEKYFAISNSFTLLVDKLKHGNRLTINYNYMYQYIATSLETDSFSETPINEISVIDRGMIVVIDKNCKAINFKKIDYEEGKYFVDSYEGMQILDQWFNFWTSAFKSIYSKSNNIKLDLTGGYDSRIAFLLALKSGIDLNDIKVFSIDDKKHTHLDDFKIAELIAKSYNFVLNKNIKNSTVNYSLKDIVNIEFYTKMGFQKEPYYILEKTKNKIFHIKGVNGECIRALRWDKNVNDFTDEMIGISTYRYPEYICKKIHDCSYNIFNNGFEKVINKYQLTKESRQVGHYLSWDTLCRTHGGKASVVSYFGNTISLIPIFDPVLLKLNLNTKDCSDNNLLMILIYIRYGEELLNFPFEGNRVPLSEVTIRYAKKISNKFTPNINVINFSNFNINSSSSSECFSNTKCSNQLINDFLKDIFSSSTVKGSFIKYFPEEIYNFAFDSISQTDFYPLRHAYTILSIAKIIDDTECRTQSVRYDDVYEQLLNFKRNGYKLSTPAKFLYFNHIDYYRLLTARVDFEFSSNTKIDFSCNLDASTYVTKPSWFQKNGKGYVVQTNSQNITIFFTSFSDCNLRIYLRGIDFKENNKRVQSVIIFNKFVFNGKDLILKQCLVSHDNPYIININLKSNIQNTVKINWLPDFNELMKYTFEKLLK